MPTTLDDSIGKTRSGKRIPRPTALGRARDRLCAEWTAEDHQDAAYAHAMAAARISGSDARDSTLRHAVAVSFHETAFRTLAGRPLPSMVDAAGGDA